MRRSILLSSALLFVLGFACLAQAQLLLTGAGKGTPGCVGCGGGSVAFDAQGTAAHLGGTPTSITDTSLTVGSGSNRALVVELIWLQQTPTSVSVIWDSGGANQALSLIGSVTVSGGSGLIQFWGYANAGSPLVSGAKTLAASWTNGANVDMVGVSWTGVNQTGGATSFPNFTSSTTTGSVTVTSAATHAAMGAFWAGGSVSAVNNTQIFLENAVVGGGGNYLVPGTASAVMTGTGANGAAGIDISP